MLLLLFWNILLFEELLVVRKMCRGVIIWGKNLDFNEHARTRVSILMAGTLPLRRRVIARPSSGTESEFDFDVRPFEEGELDTEAFFWKKFN